MLYVVLETVPSEPYLYAMPLAGATMYIIPDSVIYDPVLLCQFLETHAISRMLFTPSLLEAVLDVEGVNVTQSLRSMK